jgi:signal recognition particle GTPase
LGTGEKSNDLGCFTPTTWPRAFWVYDVLSLIERAEEVIDEDVASTALKIDGRHPI